MRKVACLLFVLCASCWAQTDITVQPNALTAILDFRSPDANEDCTVDLTFQETSPGTPNWSNPIPWSDRLNFPTLSVVPRGSVDRRVILGGEPFNVRRGIKSAEQMGLPNSTRIYGQIACGPRAPVPFEFRTKPYPQGLTYGPLMTVMDDYSGGLLLPSAHLDVRKPL